MSYEPTVWQTGDVVTAEKMNKLEQGVASAGEILFANKIYDEVQDIVYLDITFNEIVAAIDNGKCVVLLFSEGEYERHATFVVSTVYDDLLTHQYQVLDSADEAFLSDSADGTLVSNST